MQAKRLFGWDGPVPGRDVLPQGLFKRFAKHVNSVLCEGRVGRVVIPIEVYNCIPGMLVLNTGLRGGWLRFWSLTDVIPGMT